MSYPPPSMSGPAVAVPTPATLLPPPEQALLASAPRPRFPLVPMLMVGAIAVGGGLLLSNPPDDTARMAQLLFSTMIVVGAVGVATVWGAYMARRLRDEDAAVGRAEAAIMLRRHDAATWELAALVGAPMLSPLARARALAAYVTMLARTGRHDEAVRATDALLAEGVPDAMVPALRAVRTIALLRDDRLIDADRAINDLRKLGRDGQPGAFLALVEAYRDVRTGHGDDVLSHHTRRRALVRDALGTRVADLDALAAWAALRHGDEPGAAALWRRATVVRPAPELIWLYPELAEVAARLAPPNSPQELAVAPQGASGPQGGWVS